MTKPNETGILIVDDARPIRSIIKSILREAGFVSIYEAADGQDALRILESSKIGLILADWNMPGVTGIDLLDMVRSNELIKDIPFLMVTGERDKHKVLQAAKLGVTGYLLKPIDAESLVSKVIKTLTTKPSNPGK